MLEEFKKCNSLEEENLYLNTIGNTLLKVDTINHSLVQEILELDEYLNEIDYWNLYNGPFLQLVSLIEMNEEHNSLERKKMNLTEDELFKLNSICKGVFSYEKPIIMDIYDGNNNEIASILISGKEVTYKEFVEWPRINAENKLIEMMESKGHVDIHYWYDNFVIKTLC